jgi:hypothetical protein
MKYTKESVTVERSEPYQRPDHVISISNGNSSVSSIVSQKLSNCSATVNRMVMGSSVSDLEAPQISLRARTERPSSKVVHDTDYTHKQR